MLLPQPTVPLCDLFVPLSIFAAACRLMDASTRTLRAAHAVLVVSVSTKYVCS